MDLIEMRLRVNDVAKLITIHGKATEIESTSLQYFFIGDTVIQKEVYMHFLNVLFSLRSEDGMSELSETENPFVSIRVFTPLCIMIAIRWVDNPGKFWETVDEVNRLSAERSENIKKIRKEFAESVEKTTQWLTELK